MCFRSRNHKLPSLLAGPFLRPVVLRGLVIFVHLIHLAKKTAGYPSLEPLAWVPQRKDVSFLQWPFSLPGLALMAALEDPGQGFGERGLMSLALQVSMGLVPSSLVQMGPRKALGQSCRWRACRLISPPSPLGVHWTWGP